MVDNNFPPSMGQQGIPMAQPQGNPLAKHLRQPKIYIKLPSDGEYWPGKSLEKTENGEYPVYAMTAKDEITFKTPDALLNGQATVDVIQSCIPNIKDAWQTPSIDIDTILIAIRRASYGEKMAMTASVPKTNITKDFELNLQTLFDNYMSKEFVHTFQIDGFKVQIQPLNYKTITEGMIKAFEEQRIFAVIDDNTIQNQEKLKQFQTSFSRLTELNVQTLIKSVLAIQPDGSEEAVVNPVHIKEFIENTDAKVFNQIKDHIESQKKQFEQQPLSVEADDDEIAAGADKTYNVPIVFDQGNFFD